MRLTLPALIVAAGLFVTGPLACTNADTAADPAQYPNDPGSKYAERLQQGKDADGSLPKPKQMPAEVKSDPKSPVIPEKTQ